MANPCAACKKVIRTAQQMQCAKCTEYYHATCVNVTDLRAFTEEAKLAWICPLCKSSLPKTDNSNTPARAGTSGGGGLVVPPGNVMNSRKLNVPAPSHSPSPAVTPEPDPLETLIIEIKLMREDMSDMKTQMKLLSDHMATRLDEFGSRCRDLEEREIAREAELCSLRMTVTDLRHQLNYMEQAGLKNELEISGITETKEESLIHIVRVTAQKIGVDMSDTDLDSVIRVGPRRRDDDDSTKLPRPVVMRFVRRQKREEFLKAAKSRRSLTSTDIEVEGPSRRLYFNDRLTQQNRYLFRSTRLRAKEAEYKYCWVRNGIVHIRRQEGTPAIAIKSQEDLEHHLGSHTSQLSTESN